MIQTCNIKDIKHLNNTIYLIFVNLLKCLKKNLGSFKKNNVIV